MRVNLPSLENVVTLSIDAGEVSQGQGRSAIPGETQAFNAQQNAGNGFYQRA